MGHMGYETHGHNFLNTARIFSKCLQYVDMDVLYLNIL